MSREGQPGRGVPPRRAALTMLRAVRQGDAFDRALAAAVEGLGEADRRLAHEIAAGVLRTRHELDDTIRPRVTGEWRRVTDDVRDLLRIGAYQLTALTRVPPHAAVAATVEVTKQEHGDRSAGFVNAVLRRLARERAEGAAPPAPPHALESAADLGRHYSHPEWLVARWLDRYGRARTTALLEHNNRPPATVLQPARWSGTELEAALAAAAIPFETSPERPGYAVRGVRIKDLPGFAEGGFVVQDAAQALALAHLRIPDGAQVWDACAAPGGKTAVLARRCRVIASDVRRARLPRLVETVRRAAPTALVLCADALHVPFAAGRTDVVVVDVPCTATGTLARHPDARWRASPARLARLTALQETLLDAAAPIVRPGGALGYMTCSLEPEENEHQVSRFLARHPEYRRDGDDFALFPPDRGTDGAYATRLVRTA